jgi:ATP-dependent Clp protease, protease subunit
MSLRKLPQAVEICRPKNYQWEAPADILGQWSKVSLAAEAGSDNVISIYEMIGEDPWTGEGFPTKRMAAALRNIGPREVTVKINSPGGDAFEGIAMYNLLREHPAKVTVEVMGMAASAASIIAMAGDTITMGLGTFMMVHNSWGVVVGNRHDMRAGADLFDNFDSALADIYVARTGLKPAEVEMIMDDETFMSPQEAVDLGFADEIGGEQAQTEPDANNMDRRLIARRQAEAVMARAGMTRNQRTELFADLGVTKGAARDAGSGAERDAGSSSAAIRRLIETIKQ